MKKEKEKKTEKLKKVNKLTLERYKATKIIKKL